MIYEFNGYTPVIHESAFVHELAAVTGNVIIGEKVYIGPGAAIRGDWGEIKISDGCNVQEICLIENKRSYWTWSRHSWGEYWQEHPYWNELRCDG